MKKNIIKKYKEFINEGIFDLLSGYSMEEVKNKLNKLTPLDRFFKLKDLKLKYKDVYTKDEIDNFIGLDNICASDKYDWIDNFYDGLARVILNDKMGFIDINNNVIIPSIYNWVSNFSNNRAVVYLNRKYGLIDENGKEIIPLKYDYIFENVDGTVRAELNGKCGLIDINGNIITQFKYDWIDIFKNSKASVKINNKFGYIDENGNEYWD